MKHEMKGKGTTDLTCCAKKSSLYYKTKLKRYTLSNTHLVYSERCSFYYGIMRRMKMVLLFLRLAIFIIR